LEGEIDQELFRSIENMMGRIEELKNRKWELMKVVGVLEGKISEEEKKSEDM
jgi:hypothetical protein